MRCFQGSFAIIWSDTAHTFLLLCACVIVEQERKNIRQKKPFAYSIIPSRKFAYLAYMYVNFKTQSGEFDSAAPATECPLSESAPVVGLQRASSTRCYQLIYSG